MDRPKKDILESETDVRDLVVIDNGTETVKIGLSGEDYPRVLIDTISGSQNIKNESEGISNKTHHLFGNALKQAVLEKKHEIEYNYPIKRGVIRLIFCDFFCFKAFFLENRRSRSDERALGICFGRKFANFRDQQLQFLDYRFRCKLKTIQTAISGDFIRGNKNSIAFIHELINFIFIFNRGYHGSRYRKWAWFDYSNTCF